MDFLHIYVSMSSSLWYVVLKREDVCWLFVRDSETVCSSWTGQRLAWWPFHPSAFRSCSGTAASPSTTRSRPSPAKHQLLYSVSFNTQSTNVFVHMYLIFIGQRWACIHWCYVFVWNYPKIMMHIWWNKFEYVSWNVKQCRLLLLLYK